MKIDYMDRILTLYPGIEHVVVWAQEPVTGEEFSDPYLGIIWNNLNVPKPSKEVLDGIPLEECEASKLERFHNAPQWIIDSL